MPTELHSSQRQLYQPEIQKIEIFLDLLIFDTVSPILSSEVRETLKTELRNFETPNFKL